MLKLGGSVITDKSSEEPRTNESNMKRLAKEIGHAYGTGKLSLIIIHGAGSFGHTIVKRTGIHNGIRKPEDLLAMAETQRSMNELNMYVVKELIATGVPAMPFQASASAVMNKGKLESMDHSAIKGLLDRGIVPVLYGVPAFDKEQGCSILSGDQIAPYLAKELKATKVIHATTVDGVYTADPNTDVSAKQIKEINKDNFSKVKEMLGGSSTTDVTGGMMRKVTELKGMGIEAQIIDANINGRVQNALLGEKSGTIVML